MIAISVGHEQFVVPERAAGIIQWVASHAGRICEQDKVRIVLNCAGKRVYAEMTDNDVFEVPQSER